MLDTFDFDLNRQTDTRISTHELISYCSGLMAKPFIPDASADSTEVLLKNNMFLNEPIFTYWKTEFKFILENIGAKTSFSLQRRVFLDYVMREIEWRMLYRALTDNDALRDTELVKAMLSGVDWLIRDDNGSSYAYILDTRKWVSRLTTSSLDIMAQDVFLLNLATISRLSRYETVYRSYMEKKLQAANINLHSTKRVLKKKSEAIVNQYGECVKSMREAIAEQSSRWDARTDFERLDEQWDRRSEPDRPEGERAIA
jgi:hypothetical protein